MSKTTIGQWNIEAFDGSGEGQIDVTIYDEGHGEIVQIAQRQDDLPKGVLRLTVPEFASLAMNVSRIMTTINRKVGK